MARYRPVATHIWRDPAFQRYTARQKLIFLYLISNESTTESGIYPVTTTTIAQGTDIPEKEVQKIMGNGLKNVTYDLEDEMVFVHHFLKYNRRGHPDKIKRSIEIDYEFNPHSLWHVFKKFYPAYCENIPINSIKDKDYTITTTTGDLNKSPRHLVNIPKIKYLNNVYLTAVEKEKLDKKYGELNVDKIISFLDNYITDRGKEKYYKSHYHTIIRWVAKEVIGDEKDKYSINPDWRKRK